MYHHINTSRYYISSLLQDEKKNISTLLITTTSISFRNGVDTGRQKATAVDPATVHTKCGPCRFESAETMVMKISAVIHE
jgi:hypothetical protein